jgi:transcription antitermination factor NusG
VKIWSDRKKKVLVPLFPGYVFVLANESERIAAIKNNSGVIRYIFYNNKPAVISQEELNNIEIALKSPERIFINKQLLREGNKISVKKGIFKGMNGFITELRGNYKLTVRLEELNLSFCVTLNSDEIDFSN